MSTTPDNPPPGVSREEFAAHLERQSRTANSRSARRGDGIEFSELVAQFGSLPAETPEEAADREKRRAASEKRDRLSSLRRICPPEFIQPIDRAQLRNPAAFDAVAGWDGRFPGPIAFGGTGSSKTRAAWSAVARLHVENGRSFAWFPVKRLIAEIAKYENKDLADEFWRYYRGYNLLLVDDLDKFNTKFESEGATLFQFYDWVYREQRPCITTTNKGREWWTELMGDAFARRLFDDAHTPVDFDPVKKP